jgi:hypothetical protein
MTTYAKKAAFPSNFALLYWTLLAPKSLPSTCQTGKSGRSYAVARLFLIFSRPVRWAR